MTILQAAGGIRKVALWLGHAGTNTTQVYLRADPLEKLSIIEGKVPPNPRHGQFQASDELIAILTSG